MPRVATFSAASYRQWISQGNPNSHCANSGYVFPLLIPSSGDGYTLSQLGTAQTGAYSWDIDTGYIKYLINGQGKGVFGTGIQAAPSPSTYMLLYDRTGTANYSYNYFDDCFQPGTPHEMCGIYVDGVLALGGGNEPGSPTGTANGTVRSWQLSNGEIVVLMGNASTYGHAVFQYFSYPGESIVRMQMSYTNTTSSSHTVQIQRGGDPDWDEFPTFNGRGTDPVPVTNTVWSTGQLTDNTISLYTPGNSYTCNTKVSETWPLYNPAPVLAGGMDGSPADDSIYTAWDLGTVAPGDTVYVTCFYIIGVGLTSFPSYIC